MGPEHETVYSAEPLLARPFALLAEVFRELRMSKHLMLRLFMRDLMSQHRQTFLGYAWILIPPVATAAVWLLLNAQGVVNVAETGLPYPVFVLAGTTLWSTAAAAIQKPLMAFNSGKPVLTRLRVPPEPYIITGAMQVFVDFLVKLALLIPVAGYFGLWPTWGLLPALACGAATVFFGTALGLLLVPLGTLYEDINRSLTLLLGVALYLVPQSTRCRRQVGLRPSCASIPSQPTGGLSRPPLSGR
jgi:lipopolysaccharide transport system permease protein